MSFVFQNQTPEMRETKLRWIYSITSRIFGLHALHHYCELLRSRGFPFQIQHKWIVHLRKFRFYGSHQQRNGYDFQFKTYNPGFTQIEIWFRFIFLTFTFIVTVGNLDVTESVVLFVKFLVLVPAHPSQVSHVRLVDRTEVDVHSLTLVDGLR